MSTPSSASSSSVSLSHLPEMTSSERAKSALSGTIWIRELKAQLEGIHRTLHASNLNDEMTLGLRHWYESFSLCLKLHCNRARQTEHNPAAIYEEFVVMLQQLLVDPLTNTSLDLNPLLGSDGRTYSSYSLGIFRSTALERVRQRSPMDVENPAVLTTRDHPVVRELQAWLQQRDRLLAAVYAPAPDLGERLPEHPLLSEPERKRDGESHEQKDPPRSTPSMPPGEVVERPIVSPPLTLPMPSPIPSRAVPPSVTDIRIQQILALQADRRRRREGDVQQHRENVEEEVRQEVRATVQRAFQPVERRIEEVDRIARTRLVELDREFAAQLAVVDRALVQQNNAIEALEKENQALAAQLSHVHSGIDALEKENLQSKKAISDCQLAIEQRKGSNQRNTRRTLGILGVCAFATWVIACTLLPPAGGVTGLVMPLKGGGGFIMLGINSVKPNKVPAKK